MGKNKKRRNSQAATPHSKAPAEKQKTESGVRSHRKNVWPLAVLILLLVFAAGAAAFWFLSRSGNLVAGAYKDYNVLFITLDTLRADHLPIYGYTKVKTPNLDRFAAAKNMVPKPILGKLPVKPSPDYKIELSSKAPAAPSAPGLPSLPSIPTPSLPSLPDLPKPDLTKDLAKDKIKDIAKDEASSKVEEVKKPEIKDGTVKRPAIFFLKGLDVFSSPSNSESGYAGVGRIAESIEGSRIYGWDQKDEVMKEIKKIHPDYPVVLVGHSLGGDTAVEIADQLDSLKENFRSVDLLVTIDAIGFSHDIIPQNVKRHLNVFGEKSLVLNDGPHVARREEKTSVRNILSPHDHTDIDDDREIQFEIVSLIQKTLKEAKV